jgi:hypothetical protein
MIVAPERLVPGINASAWNRPSFTASFAVSWSTSGARVLVLAPLGPQDDHAAHRSAHRHGHRIEQHRLDLSSNVRPAPPAASRR